ncbi:unnamed protein product [Rodentolepis nana]|uniref:Usp domain-containing protein n=1 Tax=Rodentolepis nana TaxID=102285 RepID=A0A0R3TY71_RODNA|nr:unnamed protein product [Rodentolepis nana]
MSDRTFLFPVDDKKSTEKAFLWFINTFAQSRDVIIVMHVIKPIGDIVEELGYSVFSTYPVPSRGLAMDNRIAAARKICSTYLEHAHVRGLTGVRGSISTHMRVEEAILNSAIANKATTIVISTRGLGRWRLFMGNSVSGYVSKHSGIPVIIIPPCNEPRRKSQI